MMIYRIATHPCELLKDDFLGPLGITQVALWGKQTFRGSYRSPAAMESDRHLVCLSSQSRSIIAFYIYISAHSLLIRRIIPHKRTFTLVKMTSDGGLFF
jgi:hypothetical protein